MATSALRLDSYKLETEFKEGCVVHTTYEWELSRRRQMVSTWIQDKKRIGSGGFGSVWLQREEKTERLRAVKKLSRDFEPAASAGCLRELLTLVKLKDYDHLFVELFGWYENEEYIFIAMEYIEYGDLKEYMNGPKARLEAKEIIRQILEGLEVLHEKGICHRDLKPQNILIASPDPIWIKIADFGISKRTKNTALRTSAGTQGYIAPELLGLLPRILGTSGYHTHSLDMWSLGCLVHELLTSQIPFLELYQGLGSLAMESAFQLETGMSEPEIDMVSLFKYCQGQIEFPTDVLRDSQVDEEGIAFVKSLLVVDPKDRPSPAGALRNPWLAVDGCQSVWYQKLESEFVDLGIELGVEYRVMVKSGRKAHKADIMQSLPPSTDFPTLLLQAIARGFHLAASRLIKSPSSVIDYPTTKKIFKEVAKVGQLDVIVLLLERIDVNTHVYSRTDGRTVLQWAIKARHCGIMTLLLDSKTKSKFNITIDYQNISLWAVKYLDINILGLLLGRKDYIDSWKLVESALEPAAESGQIDTVKLLLGSGANTNAIIGSSSQAAVQAAAKGGHIDIVKLLLERGVDINIKTRHDHTTLQAAAGGGHIDVVKLLLDRGADINAEAGSKYGRTALQAAAEGGHIDVVKLLLDRGADINARAGQSSGRTALQAAAGGGHIDVVKLFIDSRANINARAGQSSGRTALQAAAGGGHIDVVKLLIDSGASIGVRAGRSSGRTALQAAAGGGHIDVVKLLLDRGADINAKAGFDSGRTALQAAAEGGHIGVVRLLLDSEVDINAKAGFDSCRTALQAAAEGGHIDMVKLLLDSGANINAEAGFGSGRTALQAAAGGGRIDVVGLLIGSGANINAEAGSRYGRTALQAAAGGGHIDVVKLLIDSGANINARAGYEFGRTALQAAAEGGHIGVVKLLLDSEVDINAKAGFDSGRAALQAAAGDGHIGVVKLLLDRGADINAEAGFDSCRTALQAAAGGGHIDVVKLLLDRGANIDAKAGRSSSQTALQAAAEGGHIGVVKLLLDRGADINAKADSGSGRTALQAAVGGGHIGVVKLLLDSGADTNAKAGQSSGRTAPQAATWSIRRFFLGAGAK